MVRGKKFSIVIDSNEYHVANTWSFPGYICHVQPLLKHGCDYSVRGQLGLIGVERKSFPDYVRCIGKDWERFKQQLNKLRKNKYHAVIIEGNLDSPIPQQSRMVLGAISKRTAQIMAHGVPLLFASDSYRAATLCTNFFTEALKRIRNGK